ncbi:hypothetical protein K7X08_032688 [Anisodus acutangulus]|uniref:EF-hand domain-containing protein n=1 Tax=Anisodus acutangulus TaxID=402998 RepID=A0A9Q1RSB5_9SOLA|nr:hypothetical protein K7X08_032688 [Anisodus acutangulus]
MIPEVPRDDFEFVFNKLDVTCDSKINLDEFARLCNVIALKFEEKDSMSIVEKFPKFYHSPASKKLRDFIRSPTFEYIIVFILLVNFVAVIVETMLDVQNNSAQIFWQKAENIFVTEEITTLVGPHGLTFMSNGNWIRYLLIGRMLRFIRLLMHIERFHAFVTTFFTLLHCLLPYLGTIFCILCIYCSLGLQIFGGIVNMGNPKLHQTDLAGYDYLLFNFNDYPNGMVTLFQFISDGNLVTVDAELQGTDGDLLNLCLLFQLLSYCRFMAIKFDCSICLGSF